MIKVQGLRRNVKNVVKNYSDAQIKVREATSNDPWGPSGSLMSEIADLSFNVVACSEIMQVIWKRLNDHGKNWKHVYKALVLLEYLLKSGSERVAQQCKENIFVIETLKDFHYIEENKDQGVNVREKAKSVVALLKDDERLQSERVRTMKARERFAHTCGSRKEFPERKSDTAEFSDLRNYLEDDVQIAHAVFSSELEQVCPKTAGEEELQLQLALAMSKEDADQAERLKRNDELRLQMALAESKESYEQNQNEKEPSSAEDLIDVFTSPQASNNIASQNADPWNVPDLFSSDTAVTSVSHSALTSGNARNLNSVQPANMQDLLNYSENPADAANMTNSQSCYDFSGMQKSLSEAANMTQLMNDQSSVPQKFLGDSANLVNFDALIESRSHGNPFQATRPVQPSINELRAQNTNFSSATLPKPVFQSLPFAAAKSDATQWKPSNNPFM